VGEMSVLESLDAEIAGRSATVVTLEPCTVVVVERSVFQACLQSMPTLALNLVRILSHRLRVANMQLHSLAHEDVHGRVARQLLLFEQAYGRQSASGEIELPLRLLPRDLASLIHAPGAEVETTLVGYERLGLITTGPNHRVTIRDHAALVAQVGHRRK
jgi:CRP/FNR family cyclic AMP-dependent transcriptional regulator